VDYPDAIEYLLQLTDFERTPGMSSADPSWNIARMRSLLDRLGNPQDGRLTVHVTGSKGKGSVAAMLASVLTQAGYTTGLYVSPHLHDYTERISIDTEALSRDAFAAAISELAPYVEEEIQSGRHGSVTTFEVLTAAAFATFRERHCDVQVVEVGLGGRFDATNVFAEKDLAVFTPISLEHTEILGPTEAAIAEDKAHIITPGATAIISAQRNNEALLTIERRARELGVRALYVPARYGARVEERHPWGQSFRVFSEGGDLTYRIPLLGGHQVENALTVLACVDELRRRGLAIPDLAVANGLSRVRWPGRLEVMGQAPLLVADGAHNGESALRLCEALKESFGFRRAFFILGVNRGKDVREIAMHLSRMAEMIIATRSRNPRAMDPEEIVPEAGFLGPPCVVEPTVAAAMELALGHATSEDLVCATGSLFVAAEAREFVLGASVVRGT
jgi:dihydrofolate synthase/folylpolyglutamate synthase